MMHLIRWAALAAAALLCTGPAIAAEKRYGLTSFETIEVDADVTVEVTARAPVSAVASGSQDALDRLLVEARDKSDEHTSELQSLMRISYAVLCLKKKHP